MKLRIMLPAIMALTLFAAAPASADIYARYAYAPQGGGGAGPYAPSCRGYKNFNQRQRCTTLRGLYYRHHYYRRHYYRRHYHHHYYHHHYYYRHHYYSHRR
jgi:hypothetical protein